MKAILRKLFSGTSLLREEMARAMELILTPSGEAATPEQIAAFLGALRAKGETQEEIAGIAVAIRAHAVRVPVKRQDLMDCCGTGGDGLGTFNISTAASFVLAGGGLGVAKHGNRSVSSACGSCDVLEALGVGTALRPVNAARCIDEIGFGFLMAPAYHPALARAASVRRALGVPTVFNLIGPLVNPARVKVQVIGVYDERFLELMIKVLQELGTQEALVLRAKDGLDEISLGAETDAVRLHKGRVSRMVLSPEDAGFARVSSESLRGGDAVMNAMIIERILEGESGAHRDVVALNAGAAFWIAGKAPSLEKGARLAERVIDSGKARDVLRRLREFGEGTVEGMAK